MNKTRKLVIMITALVAVIALSGTTTYAWFSMNDTVDVSGLNLQVTSYGGLEISANHAEGSYRTQLSQGSPGMPAKDAVRTLAPVSPKLAVGSNAWDNYVFEKMTRNQTSGTREYTNKGSVSDVNTDKDFFVQNFWIKSDNAMELKLTSLLVKPNSSTTNTYSYINPFAQGATPTYPGYTVSGQDTLDVSYYDSNNTGANSKQGDRIVAYAQNAIRVAIFIITGEGTGESPYVYTLKYIYNPNYDQGWKDNNLAADLFDCSYGDAYGTTNTTEVTCANGVKLNGVSKGGDTLGNITDKVELHIAVVVWLEGKDGDCFNGIIGDDLTIDFEISGIKIP
ncbi:MAG: hypothetical protein RR248_02150 [Clostridia bacterium]